MPTPTPFRVNVRVIHRSKGRGKVVRLYPLEPAVAVLFDGAPSAERVNRVDLVPMPSGMSKAVDRIAGAAS